MECKKIHNKLIFFVEKELPVSEMKQVEEHLANCSDCALFVEEMKKSIGILELDKSAEQNPFFYTRVKARLENQEHEVVAGSSVLVRILQPTVFSILLLLGVYGGIKLGQPAKYQLSPNTATEQQMIPYLNELDAEPIEAFLMN